MPAKVTAAARSDLRPTSTALASVASVSLFAWQEFRLDPSAWSWSRSALGVHAEQEAGLDVSSRALSVRAVRAGA